MLQATASLSRTSREQELADDSLKSALLSRFIVAGLPQEDAAETSNLIASGVLGR